MRFVAKKNEIAHQIYMRRCFQLAALGESYVAPNPMVGAVLVHEGRIIGEGYHQRYGEAHAEVNCLNSVSETDRPLIPLSTLYVSLEPCAHYGKTPPCADLIIRHHIPKVVIAVQDNFHAVNGKGIERLRSNGIEVTTGILEEEGKALIRHFLYFQQHQRPYITLKLAQTADGYIGIREQELHISNALSKRYVHHLRAQHQGILVGRKTALTDNPELNVRHWQGKNPVRIVLGDASGIPAEYHIFNNAAETIFLSGDKKLSVREIVHQLYEHSLISVLVEGGADVLQQFIDSNTWNEAHLITSDKTIAALTSSAPSGYIKAPAFNGHTETTLSLANDSVQIIKNPHAVSYP